MAKVSAVIASSPAFPFFKRPAKILHSFFGKKI